MGKEGSPHPAESEESPIEVTLLQQAEEEREVCPNVKQVHSNIEESKVDELEHCEASESNDWVAFYCTLYATAGCFTIVKN